VSPARFYQLLRPHPGTALTPYQQLLPAFPGATAVADALAYGVRVTGVTVHLVDEQVDHGPILAQEAVPVVEGDTVASLTERLHEVEHRLLPAATAAVLEGRVHVDGRRVAIGGRST